MVGSKFWQKSNWNYRRPPFTLRWPFFPTLTVRSIRGKVGFVRGDTRWKCRREGNRANISARVSHGEATSIWNARIQHHAAKFIVFSFSPLETQPLSPSRYVRTRFSYFPRFRYLRSHEPVCVKTGTKRETFTTGQTDESQSWPDVTFRCTVGSKVWFTLSPTCTGRVSMADLTQQDSRPRSRTES